MSENASILRFESRRIRMLQKEGEAWWVAKDVCAALGLNDVSKAIERLDDDEKGTNNLRTPGGAQAMLVVNEAGLYSLMLTSRKPGAKRFKRWVTHEVLPSLRKNGFYSSGRLSPEAEAVLEMVKGYEELRVRVSKLERQLAEAQEELRQRPPASAPVIRSLTSRLDSVEWGEFFAAWRRKFGDRRVRLPEIHELAKEVDSMKPLFDASETPHGRATALGRAIINLAWQAGDQFGLERMPPLRGATSYRLR